MTDRRGLWRSRWAAIGAAVAVTLGAGGIVAVNAQSTGPASVLVPIVPCRLVDTRPAPETVGPRAVPLGNAETVMFSVHGANGNCTIPANATGISTNVTIVSPTGSGFLTLFPGGAARPLSSSLNWVAGQAPTPNAVTVGLGSAGTVSVYNHSGTVNVIIDIVGYYEPTADTYTKAELDAYLAYADDQIGAALDGKVDKGAPIVVTHGAGEFARFVGPLPTKFEPDGHVLYTSGDGVIIMPLSAPTSVGGITYRLSSVQWCLANRAGPTYGAYVAGAEIFGDPGNDFDPTNPFTQYSVDTTQRPSAFGCYTLSVPPPVARGYSLVLQLGGQTTNLSEATLVFRAVRSTWVPA